MNLSRSIAQKTRARQSNLFSLKIPISNTITVASSYHITDLGTLGGPLSVAKDINDSAQIVGYSITNNDEKRAFVWDSNDGIQDIGTLGDDLSCAYGINDYGQVAGYSVCNHGQSRAFVWDATNGIQDLNTPDYSLTEAYSINNVGQIVGLSITPNGQRAAFIWDGNNGMKNIGIAGEVESSAFGINNFGQVVGYSVSSDLIVRAFKWDSDQGIQELPGFLGSDINRYGRVVGFYTLPEDSNRAFVWDGSDTLDLGTVSGDVDLQFFDSEANSINDFGLVVGYSDRLININQRKWDRRAFICDRMNNMQDLNDLIDPDSGWIVREAQGINNHGQIVGWGNKNNNRRAFLLTPISHENYTFA
ncbi:MAG: DUF3466 family protein [Microcoleaceae cyanobacterium]